MVLDDPVRYPPVGLGLDQYLSWAVARYASRVAVIDDGHRLTFAELDRRVDACAAMLAARGAAGGRVVLYAANRREWLETFFAGQRAGCSVAVINPRLTAAEVRSQLEELDARLIVHDGQGHRGDVVAEVSGDLLPAVCMGPDYEAALGSATDDVRRQHEESCVIFTSGSSGKAKGVRLTQSNQVLGNLLGPTFVQRLRSDDVTLVFTSLSHRVAQVRAFSGLLNGGTVVLTNDASTEGFSRAVQQHGVTITGMVPTIIRDLSGGPGDGFPSIRLVSLTGENLDDGLRSRAQAAFPSADFWAFYASTEAGAVTALPPEAFLTHSGSSGIALPGVQIGFGEAVGESGPGAGKAREILVRAGRPGLGGLAAGYLGDARDFVDDDGFYPTGDLGYLDDDGHLHVTGRLKDVIRSGGLNIAATEVEEALLRHDDIREAAVTAEKDDRLGERVAAWVVLREGSSLTSTEISEHVTSHLASYKKPRSVYVVDTLPRTTTGKVAKWRLYEPA